jgi:phosphoglycolate phosphatase-like HAD superfamily hydrolase
MMRAIIFDLDETLVDTRDHVLHCHVRTLNAFGHAVTYDALKPHIRPDRMKAYRHSLGVTDEMFYESPNGVFAHRVPMAESLEKGYVKALPGATEFLHEAAALDYKLAIVTNTDKVEVEHKVKLLGFDWEEIGNNHIGTVVCSEKGEPKKPDPATALRALQNLGITSPEGVELIVVGDSSNDTGVGMNLRKLGYAVKIVLINHYDEEYAKTVGEYDVMIHDWTEGRLIL